jgi:hypothetical protein
MQEAVRQQRVEVAQKEAEARRDAYNQHIEEEKQKHATVTGKTVDLSVEPKTPEEHIQAEVYLEGIILKDLLPDYNGLQKVVQQAEEDLAYELAHLKAVRVGKGREGKWEPYVLSKLQPLTVRTIDRWIAREIKRGNLPAWVVARLTVNRKRARLASPDKAIKMSLPLLLDEVEDQECIQRAVDQLGMPRVTEIILKALREEMGE